LISFGSPIITSSFQLRRRLNKTKQNKSFRHHVEGADSSGASPRDGSVAGVRAEGIGLGDFREHLLQEESRIAITETVVLEAPVEPRLSLTVLAGHASRLDKVPDLNRDLFLVNEVEHDG
jgi:hypothetical protein